MALSKRQKEEIDQILNSEENQLAMKMMLDDLLLLNRTGTPKHYLDKAAMMAGKGIKYKPIVFEVKPVETRENK